MITNALELGTQLLIIDDKPEPRKITSIVQPYGWPKPILGGLWTSTYDAQNHTSAWNERCLQILSDGKQARETWKQEWWLLTPEEDYTAYVVNSLTDFEKVLKSFGYDYDGHRYLDFKALKREGFDAFHVTAQGYIECCQSWKDGLGMWECESTFWFRWCFTKVEQI